MKKDFLHDNFVPAAKSLQVTERHGNYNEKEPSDNSTGLLQSLIYDGMRTQ